MSASPARDGEAVEQELREVARAIFDANSGLIFGPLDRPGDLYAESGITQHVHETLARAAIATLLARGWLPKEGES